MLLARFTSHLGGSVLETIPAPLATSSADHDDLTLHVFARSHRAEIAPLWSQVEELVQPRALMTSWDWTETWLQHYGDVVDHSFVIAHSHGAPCAAALVTHSQQYALGPLRAPVVHIGTAGEPRGESVATEYNRLLAEPAARHPFAHALTEYVRDELRPAAILLNGFAPRDAYALLDTAAPTETTSRPCPVFDLRSARDEASDVLSALGSGVRRRVRRSLKGFGPVQTEWAETPEQALDILDELAALHQRRWQALGKPGAFSSKRFSGFHRDLVERLLPLGQVILFRVRNASGTIGCLLSYVDGDDVLFYQSGFTETDDNKLKPGLTCHLLCMQECLERGFGDYNFLTGDARYKDELATVEREIIDATLYQNKAALSLVRGLRRIGAVDRARSLKRWGEHRRRNSHPQTTSHIANE